MTLSYTNIKGFVFISLLLGIAFTFIIYDTFKKADMNNDTIIITINDYHEAGIESVLIPLSLIFQVIVTVLYLKSL